MNRLTKDYAVLSVSPKDRNHSRRLGGGWIGAILY
jgi:hypothetical protein